MLPRGPWSSSLSTEITLPTESGEDTPEESLSMSSVSGLNSSKDMRRGRVRDVGCWLCANVEERRTNGN